MAKAGIGSAAQSGGLSELKSRLLFVLLAIIVYRIGAHVRIANRAGAAKELDIAAIINPQ